MNPTTPFPLLALDPSSTYIGWALIGPGPSYLRSGVIPLTTADASTRIRFAGEATRSLLDHERPGSVLLEVPSYIRERANARNILIYARAVGAVEYVLRGANLPVHIREAGEHRGDSNKANCRSAFLRTTGRHATTDDESDAFFMGWSFVAANPHLMPWSGQDAPRHFQQA